MKNTLVLILLITIFQSALAQKVDWDKPLYEVYVSTYNGITIEDTIGTFSYSGDTIICKEFETLQMGETTYINGNIIKQNKYDWSRLNDRKIDSTTRSFTKGDTTIVLEYLKILRNEITYIGCKKLVINGYISADADVFFKCIYQYDSLGNLTTHKYCYRGQTNYYTDEYTNYYDSQNKLIKIIGPNQKIIYLKYRKHKKIEKYCTPKNRYRKVYYYKDLNYQNNTLIITFDWLEGNEYIETQYDSINRPTRIDYWKDYDLPYGCKGYHYEKYQYIDNLKICKGLDIDMMWEYGIIYKKEEE